MSQTRVSERSRFGQGDRPQFGQNDHEKRADADNLRRLNTGTPDGIIDDTVWRPEMSRERIDVHRLENLVPMQREGVGFR